MFSWIALRKSFRTFAVLPHRYVLLVFCQQLSTAWRKQCPAVDKILISKYLSLKSGPPCVTTGLAFPLDPFQLTTLWAMTSQDFHMSRVGRQRAQMLTMSRGDSVSEGRSISRIFLLLFWFHFCYWFLHYGDWLLGVWVLWVSNSMF